MRTLAGYSAMARAIAWGALALLVGCAPRAPDPQDADVLYLPTPHAVVEAMLRLAGVRPHDVLYDLGAGDGRIRRPHYRRDQRALHHGWF